MKNPKRLLQKLRAYDSGVPVHNHVNDDDLQIQVANSDEQPMIGNFEEVDAVPIIAEKKAFPKSYFSK